MLIPLSRSPAIGGAITRVKPSFAASRRRSGACATARISPESATSPKKAVSAATGTDPYALIFTGGEDHALGATFPGAAGAPEGWRVIGEVRGLGDDRPGVTVDGAPWDGPGGFDHFGPGTLGPR